MSGIVLLGLRGLAAIALYAFIGGTLYLLWRSLRQEAQALSARFVPPLDLFIQAPETPDRRMHYTQGNIAIGRDPDCDCVLSHSTVSARHARLTFHHSQWWVDDLQSTNGTNLNDDPLHMPTVVVNGDTIKCGHISLTVFINSQTQPSTGEPE